MGPYNNNHIYKPFLIIVPSTFRMIRVQRYLNTITEPYGGAKLRNKKSERDPI